MTNTYIKEGKIDAKILEGYCTDAGTFGILFRANELVRGEKR